MRTWIKHTLAVWTGTEADAANGIVVDVPRLRERHQELANQLAERV